jgi:RNA polymerase sigma factor (sigma-70 family)
MGEMHEQADAQLLREFAEHGNDSAFREIVIRHTDFVYSVALRCVNSPDLASDIAQSVFTDLSRKARSLADKLADNASLVGWLYRSTRFAALNQLRDDHRRRAHERQAMEQLLAHSEAGPDWDRIRPILDEAMDELKEEDRDALLLRYFKNHDFRGVGLALGVSEDAAQKRVSRAVERLREFFAKHGVTVGASGLAVVISANAVQAAPLGLAVTISSAAALSGTTLTVAATATAAKAVAMTTLQKTIIILALTAAIGTGIYQSRQAASLRSQVQALQQQQAPLTEQIQQLTRSRGDAERQLAALRDENDRLNRNTSELLKLRGNSGLAQADSRELAKLKSTLAQQTVQMPDFLTNAMAHGLSTAEKFRKKEAEARLARMKKMLNLTDDQEQAMMDITLKHIQSQTQTTMDLITGKSTPEQQLALSGNKDNQEAAIKALLTPEQMAAYPEFVQAEKITTAATAANSDAGRIAGEFKLSKEQQEQIRASFYQRYLDESADGLNQKAISAVRKNGNLAETGNISIEWQKSELEAKLKILGGILTPEQINSYREEQMDQINMQASAMKMLLPQKPAGTTN